MFETHELWAEAIKIANAKRLRHAAGVQDIGTVYRWQRSPLESDPEGTGAPGLFDRMERVIDVIGARGPVAGPLLLKMRYWLTHQIDEVMGRTSGQPLTLNELRAKSTNALREVADVVDACNTGDEFCRQKITNEALQARDVLDRIIAACEHDIEEAS